MQRKVRFGRGRRRGHSVTALVLAIVVPLVVAESGTSAAAAGGANGYSVKIVNDFLLQPYANVGSSVAIANDIVVVGADQQDACHRTTCATEVGNATVFNASSGLPIGYLRAPFAGYGVFGESASVGDGEIVIGTDGETADGISAAGGAYVYNATTFARLATLISPSPADGDVFGFASTIGDGLIVVGAAGATVGSAIGEGQAYVYNATSFKHVATLSLPSSTGIEGALFGESVAIGGGEIVVGAPGERPYGNAYVFGAKSDQFLANLSDPLGVVDTYGEFGFSVAAEKGLIAVGAPGDQSSCQSVSCPTDGGQVYLFSSKSFDFERNLSSPNAMNEGYFGWSIATAPGIVVVGAEDEDTPSGAANGGDVYVFASSTGTLIAALKVPDGATGGNYDSEGFGWSVSANKNWIAVGAVGGVYRGVACGAAYVYEGKSI